MTIKEAVRKATVANFTVQTREYDVTIVLGAPGTTYKTEIQFERMTNEPRIGIDRIYGISIDNAATIATLIQETIKVASNEEVRKIVAEYRTFLDGMQGCYRRGDEE